MRTRHCLSWGLALVLAACTSGGSVKINKDQGPGPDQYTAGDHGITDPDIPPLKLDNGVQPDKGLPPDKGPDTDSGLCGNGKVDDPPETCDKAIGAGKSGACPQSAADCDDNNACTNDSVSGSVASCTAECAYSPVSNCCGNGVVESGEDCDDGNVVNTDGCSNQCKLPGGHLLITEVATTPSDAEFIEIYNPSSSSVALDSYYLSDRTDYFQLVSSLSGGAYDFVAGFPAGATIASGAYLTVAVDGLKFKLAYNKAPDYELISSDASVPDMVAPSSKAIGSVAGLTDSGELVVLFTWDGSSDLVQDVDYVVWGSTPPASAVSKSTLICVDGPDSDTDTSCFLDDTPVAQQVALSPPQQGGSLHRCDYLETGETKSGGNGLTGHNETSEPIDGTGATWLRNLKTVKQRTPGAPAPVGFCP